MTQGLPKRSEVTRPSTAAETLPPPATPTAPEGTVVTVEWGNEHYQPLPYHGVDSGRFQVTAPVLPGETVAQATWRLWSELDGVARAIRARKIEDFLQTTVAVTERVRSTSR